MTTKTGQCWILAAVSMVLGSSLAYAAPPKSCQSVNLGAGADKMICVYESQNLSQVYEHVRSVLDGGDLLREQFPQQALSDELPENNDEGLVKAAYSLKNGAWAMALGYQGSETTVLLQPKGSNVQVEIVMSAD